MKLSQSSRPIYFNPITKQPQFEPVNICMMCKNNCEWRNALQSNFWRWLSTTDVKTIKAEYNIQIQYELCKFCNRLHPIQTQCVCYITAENKKKK
jgi:hypothetical protein